MHFILLGTVAHLFIVFANKVELKLRIRVEIEQTDCCYLLFDLRGLCQSVFILLYRDLLMLLLQISSQSGERAWLSMRALVCLEHFLLT